MSSDETSKLITFGGGENFLMINLVVSHEPCLPKKDSAVRVERVLCFHFPCLSDHMSIWGCPYIMLSVRRWGGSGKRLC